MKQLMVRLVLRLRGNRMKPHFHDSYRYFHLFLSHHIMKFSHRFLNVTLSGVFPSQEYYSNDTNADRIKRVQTQIAEVKDVMVDNIGPFK